MMLPAPLDITVYRGDGFMLPLRLREKNGDYIDLTGATGRAMARVDPDATDPLVTFTVTIDPDQVGNKGGVTLSLLHGVTELLDPHVQGRWDLELTKPASEPLTYVAGRFLVEGDYSR